MNKKDREYLESRLEEGKKLLLESIDALWELAKKNGLREEAARHVHDAYGRTAMMYLTAQSALSQQGKK